MTAPSDGRPATPGPSGHRPWRVEGGRSAPPKADGAPGAGRPRRPSFWVLIAVFFLVNWLLSSWLMAAPARTEVPYTFFRQQVDANKVAEITSTEDAIQGRFREAVTYPPGKDGKPVTRFSTFRPSFAEDDLLKDLADKGVQVDARPTPGPSLLERLLVGFGPTLLLVGLFVYLGRRAGGGLGGLGGFGSSRAQRYEPEEGKRVGFEDVAGIDD